MSQPVVLVVEDDEALSATLRRVLERAGYAAEQMPNGLAGLDRVEQGGVDLVLLDVMMPELDGLELCRRVRARQARDDVYLPIIMLTGLGSEPEHHAGFAAG